jgi:hypothetical protein
MTEKAVLNFSCLLQSYSKYTECEFEVWHKHNDEFHTHQNNEKRTLSE